jgi:hypothetical protein
MFQKTCIFRNIIHYQIEQGSDWVVSWIWSQVSSRLDMQLHNEHCQELVLLTENQLMRVVIAYTSGTETFSILIIFEGAMIR